MVVGWGCGELEGAFFESFGPDSQAVLIPVEEFEPIAATVAEDEQIPGEWVLFEVIADDSGKTIEALTHVGGRDADEHTPGQRQTQHGWLSSATTTARRWLVS
jgi:hypothetical protein